MLSDNQKGQGLIEMLIAIGIILTAVVGGLSLMVASFSAERESSNRIIAANLAREGVEIARNLRDSSWIKSQSFDSWLVNPSNDYSAVPIYDPVANSWQFNHLPDLMTDSDSEVYIDASGFLNNSDIGEKTIFRRLVNMNPICWDPLNMAESVAAEGTLCMAPTAKIGIMVSSNVSWTDKKGTHTLTAEDRLYNWRYK